MQPWETISSTELLKTHFFKVTKDRCQREHDEVDYYTIEKNDVVYIIALTKENKIILIKQYRHPIKLIGTEFPAGYLNDDETAEDAAKRELLEETGYSVERMEQIYETYTSVGTNKNKAYFFVGLSAEKTAEQNLDELEEIEVFLSGIKEVEGMIEEGEIKDMGCVLAFHLAKDYLKNN